VQVDEREGDDAQQPGVYPQVLQAHPAPSLCAYPPLWSAKQYLAKRQAAGLASKRESGQKRTAGEHPVNAPAAKPVPSSAVHFYYCSQQ
jgi:hypothetical protein